MASLDWKNWLQSGRERARTLPRWVWALGAGSVIAALLLVTLLAQGPGYAPLYEGLSAKQGGQVIDKLQKLGIPYQLNSSGSVIRVPEPELARARLKLGQMGVPDSEGSQAWSKLTQGSMTTSATAQNALSRRALENRLSESINGITGVSDSRITLALPKSTPFLKDQPHPKASVWLHLSPAGLSSTQAQAIAQTVANSVPGLEVAQVTVTDQNGNILAPVAHSGMGAAQQQLDFTSRVEHRAERHIQALLAPLMGSKNLRVSTAASIDFSKVTSRATQYGPKSKVGTLKHDTQKQIGPGNSQQGVPGALSNQPPGSAAAPLQTANNSGQNGNKGQGAGSGSGKGGQSASQPAQASTPRSSKDKWDVHYQVDQSTTVQNRAPWQMKALSVSVVLNEKTVGSNPKLVDQVKQIVSHAITAPNLKVNVAVVPFGMQNAPAPSTTSWRAYLGNASVLQAAMELLAALLILFGLAKPLSRWIREILPLPSRPAWSLTRKRDADDGESPVDARQEQRNQVEHAQDLARTRPEEAAEMLRRWIRDEPKDAQGGQS